MRTLLSIILGLFCLSTRAATYQNFATTVSSATLTNTIKSMATGVVSQASITDHRFTSSAGKITSASNTFSAPILVSGTNYTERVEGTNANGLVASFGSGNGSIHGAGGYLEVFGSSGALRVSQVEGDAGGHVVAGDYTGSGANLTSLNASQLTSGTVGSAVLTGSNAYNGSFSVIQPNQNFVFEGDSITAGYGLSAGQDWPSILTNLSNFIGKGSKSNAAVASSTVAIMAARYAASVYPNRPAATGKPAILFVLIGVNDIAALSTGLATSSNLFNYVTNAQADGFKVWVCTIFDRVDFAAAPRLERHNFNRLLRESSIPDRLIDLAPLLPDVSNTNTFQLDGVHPSFVGQTMIANFVNEAAAIAVTRAKTESQFISAKSGLFGDVSIGQLQDASYPLAVTGNAKVVGRVFATGAQGDIAIGRRDTSALRWQLYSTAGELAFYDQTANRMTITTAGNVSVPLAINAGTITATNGVLTVTNGNNTGTIPIGQVLYTNLTASINIAGWSGIQAGLSNPWRMMVTNGTANDYSVTFPSGCVVPVNGINGAGTLVFWASNYSTTLLSGAVEIGQTNVGGATLKRSL